MMDYDDFKKNCYVENLQKYLDLTKSKLLKYFKQHKIKMELIDLYDYKDFYVDVTDNVVSVKSVVKSDNSDFILCTTNLKNTPSEFHDVILNHEMFIITLINLHKTLSLYIDYFEGKINLNDEDLFQYFLSSLHLFQDKNISLQDFFDEDIKLMYIDDDKVIINDETFLTSEDQDLLLKSIYLLRFVKLLQSIKKLVNYLQDNYSSFYEDEFRI